jgi:hypothetical protein
MFGDTAPESQIEDKNAAKFARSVKCLSLSFYRISMGQSVTMPVHETPIVWVCRRLRAPGGPEAFMAIQDYVRSIAATDTVSKDQVFRFLEMQFARADRNHDGELDADELAAFVQAVAKPEADQR